MTYRSLIFQTKHWSESIKLIHFIIHISMGGEKQLLNSAFQLRIKNIDKIYLFLAYAFNRFERKDKYLFEDFLGNYISNLVSVSSNKLKNSGFSWFFIGLYSIWKSALSGPVSWKKIQEEKSTILKSPRRDWFVMIWLVYIFAIMNICETRVVWNNQSIGNVFWEESA